MPSSISASSSTCRSAVLRRDRSADRFSRSGDRSYSGRRIPLCNAGSGSTNLSRNTRQKIHEETDVIRIQVPVMFKEAVYRAAGGTTVKRLIFKFQPVTHKTGSGPVATAALLPEPGRAVRLRKQHGIDSIDLVSCEVMVVEESAKIMHVVRSTQLATGNTQKLAGKVTGMPVTFRTAVVPQPVQICSASVERRHHQHGRNQPEFRFKEDPHGKRCRFVCRLCNGALGRPLLNPGGRRYAGGNVQPHRPPTVLTDRRHRPTSPPLRAA